MRVLVSAVALLLSVPASAGDFVTTAKPQASDAAIFDRGVRTVFREVGDVTIAVRGMDEFYGRPAFQVAIMNNGKSSIDFGPENVQVKLISDKGVPLKVYTIADLEKQAKKRAGWQRFAGALAASNAGQTTYSGAVHGANGYAQFSGSSQNNYLQQQAQRQNIQEVQNGLGARLATSHELALKTSTVFPNSGHGGMVVFDKPSGKLPAELSVTVSFSAVSEEFLVSLSK